MLKVHFIERLEPWVVLYCLHYLEGIHLRSSFNKLDDRIALSLVLEITDFISVKLSINSCEVGNMSGTYFTKVKGVLNLRARVDLSRQIIDDKLEEK